jgi:hypothetical protein
VVTGSKPKHTNNVNNVRREASRHFRNKKKEYLKAKNDEHETNSKIKNIRDLYRSINDFKKGYQPRTNTVKDKKRDLVTYCHSILGRWRKHFSQLFNVHGVNDVTQTDIYRVSQEEGTKLRDSVPYVKLYRKTPKHLYPKLNGLGDNGQ